MRVEFYLKTRFLISAPDRFCLGKGVELYTDEVCDLMIDFLWEQFELNPSCFVGDIQGLIKMKKQMDEARLGKMTYKEYLQIKMSKDFGSK
jgi:hypothetical protein